MDKYSFNQVTVHTHTRLYFITTLKSILSNNFLKTDLQQNMEYAPISSSPLKKFFIIYQ